MAPLLVSGKATLLTKPHPFMGSWDPPPMVDTCPRWSQDSLSPWSRCRAERDSGVVWRWLPIPSSPPLCYSQKLGQD